MSNEHISKNFESKIVTKTQIAKKQLAEFVEKVKEKDFPFHQLPTDTNPRKIAALDGGGYSRDLIGITIMPARAAGAVFEKDKEPIWFEENDVEILTLEEDPKNYGALFRDHLEVKIALKLLDEEPEILFLDGSITGFAYKGIPQSIRYSLMDEKEIDEGSVGFKFYNLFMEYIQASYKLITQCIEKDILLVGVSKDSRANILMKEIFGKVKDIPPISDTSLVNVISNGKTGFTKPIPFSPQIRDLRKKIWKAAQVFQEEELQSFYLTYLVLKERAQPIRVDTLLPQQKRLKEVINSMVTYHDGNGFFLPAYITHKHAHMTTDLGERIINYVSEEIFEEDPELFQSFFWPKRRDVIQ